VFVLLIFVIFGVFAIVSWIGQQKARQARARRVAALAASVGFTFFAFDESGIAEMPFKMFRIGHSQHATAIISGIHKDLPLQIFDYQYVTGEGKSRQVHRNTCAIATIPAACPPLQLTHENALTRLGDHLGHHDVKLEYDDFNRRFVVNCEEQKFAFSLLDAQMMEWLLGSDSFDRVEIIGPWILIVRTRLDTSLWLSLGNWLDAFHSHIPPVVYSTFPRQ
jgi:hypothetical protein